MSYNISIQSSEDAVKYLIERYLNERTQHFIYSVGVALDPNRIKINLEKGIAEEILSCMSKNLVNVDCEVLLTNPNFNEISKYTSQLAVVNYKNKTYLLEHKHLGEYTACVDRITIMPIEILKLT